MPDPRQSPALRCPIDRRLPAHRFIPVDGRRHTRIIEIETGQRPLNDGRAQLRRQRVAERKFRLAAQPLFPAAIEALTKSIKLGKSGESFDWFFLAMAEWQSDNKEDARKWFGEAVIWMDKNQPQNE